MVASLRSREGTLVVALAALAALRVLALATAFPFFSNVDEHRHVDGVLKYARGYLPTPDNAAYEPETARYLGLLGSPEFHLQEGAQGAYRLPPPSWQRSNEGMLRALAQGERILGRRANLEAMQPPAYYVAAGLWLRLGRLLGLEGGLLLYWVRGLSAPLLFALVIVAHRGLRAIYADSALIRLGVPVLLVVFPLDAFYYVTHDALSPLVVGSGFFLAANLVRRPLSGPAATLGLAALMAIAFFTKYTNAALLGLCAVCTGVALQLRPRARRLAGEGKYLALLWLLVALPVLAWFIRNRSVFGDITGTAFKIERMGWGRKTFAEYWDHPIFSPTGLFTFVRELVPLFWRGEMAWHRVPLAWPAADAFYLVTTLLFVALAAFGLQRAGRPAAQRLLEGLALLLLAAYVGELALLSILYVFHATSNPTAALPYFVQGRLISGALVPFLIVYVRGIEVAAGWLPARLATPAAWGGVALVAGVVLLSEAFLHAPIFASPYNFYHLP